MTTPNNLLNEHQQSYWRRPSTRRWAILLILLLMLLAMGLYTITDTAHLAHSYALDGADWLGYAVCHRLTERSFAITGPDGIPRQFPLCARCSGMYLGVMIVFLAIFLSGRMRWSELPPLPIMLVLMGFMGAMAIDGINSYSHFFPNAPHLYTPRNWLRLVTGLGTGLAMGCFIIPALSQTLWRDQVFQAAIGTFNGLLVLVVMAGTAVLLLLSNQPTILYVLALVSTAGLLLILAAINTIFVLILLKRDAKAIHWRETAVPLFIGVTLAIIELTAISLVRFSLTGTMIGFPGL